MSTQARLGFSIETASLGAGAAALGAVANNADRAGIAADRAAVRMNILGQSVGPITGQQRALSAEIAATDARLAAYVARLDLATAAGMRFAQSMRAAEQAMKAANLPNTGAYFDFLDRARAQHGSLQQAQLAMRGQMGGAGVSTIGDQAKASAGGVNLLTAAVRGLAGGLAFFVANAVMRAAQELAQLPVAVGQAEDALARLDARLRFAFRGSRGLASEARDDIRALADELGIAYTDLSRQYGDLAVAGRAMGMGPSRITSSVEAFSKLGMMSGATPGQTSAAMWQVQQMMNLGTLRFQDYRYMATNMGALDDVLAAGAGVGVSELVTMISAGQVSAEKFFEYLEKGMKALEGQSGELPETIDRATARLSTAWTRLLEDMGQAIEASSLIQSMTNLITGAIDGVRNNSFPGGDERALAALHGGLTPNQQAQLGTLLGLGTPPSEINNIRQGFVRDNQTALAAQMQSARDAQDQQAQNRIDEQNNTWTSQYQQALGIANQMDTLRMQRGEVESEIGQVERGIVAAQQLGQTDEVARLQRSLRILRAQSGSIQSPFGRSLGDQAAAEQYAAQFGGAGGELASRARGMVLQGEGTMYGPGFGQALDLLLRQEQLRSTGQRLGAETDIAMQRRFVLPAIGQGARATRLAEIEAELGSMAATYGDMASNPRVQAMLGDRRSMLEGRMAFDVDRQGADAADQHTRRMRQIGLMTATANDPIARRAGQRDLEIADQERSALDPSGVRARMEEQFAAEDRALIAERIAGEERRLRILREESDLTLGVGRERRIQIDALHREEAARREGLALTREQAEAQARVADEVERSAEQNLVLVGSIERSARRVGEGIENVFFSSVRDGLRRGKIEGEDIMWGLADIALDVGQEIASALVRPMRERFVDSAASFLDVFLSNFGLGTGGKSSGGKTIPKGKLSALGNAFVGGSAQPFAMGGIASTMGYFPMANGGIGSLAEVAPEAILPLARGPDGRLGVQNTGHGGSGPMVIINDHRGADAEAPEVQETRGPDGRRMLEITLRESQRGNLAGGKMDQGMRTRYGAQPLVKQA